MREIPPKNALELSANGATKPVPFSRLPADLQCQVLLWCARSNPSISRGAAPLILSYVCRSWRTLILSISSVWATFELDLASTLFHGDEMLNMLKLWLTRAGSAPLSFRLLNRDSYESFAETALVKNVEVVLAILVGHAYHWRDVWMDIPCKCLRLVRHGINNAKEPKSCIRSMTLQLAHNVRRPHPEDRFELRPYGLPWNNLQRLELIPTPDACGSITMDELYDIFRANSKLRACHLKVRTEIPVQEEEFKFADATLCLPRLEELRLHVVPVRGENSRCFNDLLARFHCPVLQKFHYSCQVVDEKFSRPSFFAFLKSTKGSLRDLRLSEVPVSPYYIKACLKEAPSVGRFQLTSNCNKYHGISYADFSLPSRFFAEPAVLRLPHLRKLAIIFNGSQTCFCKLGAVSLLDLLDCPVLSNFNYGPCFHECPLCAEPRSALATFLARTKGNVRKIYFSSMSFGIKDAISFLEEVPNLEELGIHHVFLSQNLVSPAQPSSKRLLPTFDTLPSLPQLRLIWCREPEPKRDLPCASFLDLFRHMEFPLLANFRYKYACRISRLQRSLVSFLQYTGSIIRELYLSEISFALDNTLLCLEYVPNLECLEIRVISPNNPGRETLANSLRPLALLRLQKIKINCVVWSHSCVQLLKMVACPGLRELHLDCGSEEELTCFHPEVIPLPNETFDALSLFLARTEGNVRDLRLKHLPLTQHDAIACLEKVPGTERFELECWDSGINVDVDELPEALTPPAPGIQPTCAPLLPRLRELMLHFSGNESTPGKLLSMIRSRRPGGDRQHGPWLEKVTCFIRHSMTDQERMELAGFNKAHDFEGTIRCHIQQL